MAVYGRAQLHDLGKAVRRLPTLTDGSEVEAMKATGTDGAPRPRLVDNKTDGPTGLPVIAGGDNLTIIANGDTIERSTASKTPDFRLVDVVSGGSLTVQNPTLQNGLAFGSGVAVEGGAIYIQGPSNWSTSLCRTTPP